jgi:ATP-dependent DNA ligase
LKLRGLARTRPVTYVVFDLLYVDFRSVTVEPLLERRRRLREIVEGLDDPRFCSPKGSSARAQRCSPKFVGWVWKG